MKNTTDARSELQGSRFDLSFPEGRPFQVVGLGMNAVDWILRLPVYPPHNSKVQIESIHRLGGGPAATASALCARYGLRTRYIGRVGDDDIGRFSLEDLGKEPMDLSLVEVIPGASSQFATILVDRPSGERTVLWQRDPKLEYREGELLAEWITSGQVLHLDGHEIGSRIQAARWAREAGMKVCLDIDRVAEGVEELLQLTDFALPTEHFVRQFSPARQWRDGLLEVARIAGGFVAATRGQAGCAAVWKGRIVEVPSLPVIVVEATGAGDVFHGAFAYSLFQSWDIWRCLRFSNAAGALACTRIGARNGIPPLQEVIALLEAHEDDLRN